MQETAEYYVVLNVWRHYMADKCNKQNNLEEQWVLQVNLTAYPNNNNNNNNNKLQKTAILGTAHILRKVLM